MKVLKYMADGSGMEEVPIVPQHLGGGDTSVMIEVVLDDKRRVRLNVDSNGKVCVRAWGTTPIRLGNITQADVRFQVAKQKPTHDVTGHHPLPPPPECGGCGAEIPDWETVKYRCDAGGYATCFPRQEELEQEGKV